MTLTGNVRNRTRRPGYQARTGAKRDDGDDAETGVITRGYGPRGDESFPTDRRRVATPLGPDDAQTPR